MFIWRQAPVQSHSPGLHQRPARVASVFLNVVSPGDPLMASRTAFITLSASPRLDLGQIVSRHSAALFFMDQLAGMSKVHAHLQVHRAGKQRRAPCRPSWAANRATVLS